MKRIFITASVLGIIIFAATHWRKAPEPAAGDPDPATASSSQAVPTKSVPSRPVNPQASTAAHRPELTQAALVAEARAMNRMFRTAKDAQAEEARLETLAASLTDADRTLLVEQVTNPQQGDNIRAYSLYLLTLAPSTTPENLKAVALMPNPVAGQTLAEHSPEEWTDRTVKAFATGAVGELKKRLQQDPSIVRDLQEISQQASMPIVKKMAKNYLREAESREPASLKARKK